MTSEHSGSLETERTTPLDDEQLSFVSCIFYLNSIPSMSSKSFTFLPLKTLSRIGFQTASHHTRTTTPLFTRLTAPRIAQTVARQSIRFASSFQDEKQAMDAKEARGEQPEKAVEDWQKRAPYKIHESNENFKARYEASCHCGKVQYQLSREEPLDSKLCHCTTCQTQHGMFQCLDTPRPPLMYNLSRTIPMGRHLPQGGHQLLQWTP
jgi:hypothetical protein